MEQNANMDVEAVMTRKRARVAAAIKKFRISTLVVKACTKLSSGRGIRCDLEMDGDFSDEPEQARSEILAVLSRRLFSTRLDEEPLEESLVPSGHEGHCIAHGGAQGKMMLPPTATNVGFLSQPSQDQQERNEPFAQAVGTMYTSPIQGPGFLSVHSRGQFTTEGEKSEQDEGDWEMVDNLGPTADDACDDVSENIPPQCHRTEQQEESSQYDQHMSPNADLWALNYLYNEPELACLDDLYKYAKDIPPISCLDGMVEDSLHVATTPILNEGDAIQSGISDHLLEHVDPNLLEQVDLNLEEQVDPNRQEQVDPIAKEQTDPTEPSELESRPTSMRRKLASKMNKEIAETIGKVDQATNRRKLKGVQSEVTKNSNKLKGTIQKLQDKLEDFSDNLKRLLNCLSTSVLASVPLSNVENLRTDQEDLAREQQQQLFSAIFAVINNFSLTPLLRGLTTISENLDGLVKPLQALEFKTTDLFQNCASSVTLTVESFFKTLNQADLNFGGKFP